jgi:hypothetical protein
MTYFPEKSPERLSRQSTATEPPYAGLPKAHPQEEHLLETRPYIVQLLLTVCSIRVLLATGMKFRQACVNWAAHD